MGQLVDVLRSINVLAVAVPAIGCLSVGFILRAGRFRAVLGPSPVRFSRTVGTMVLSQAANNVLPLRAGELVKTRDFVAGGHPIGRVVAAQGAEKLVELTMFVLVCAPALAIRFGYGGRVIGLAAILVAALVPLVWIAPRFGVRAGQVRRALAWALAADAVEVILVSVTLRGLGLTSGLVTSIIVLGAVNLSIALPSAPSHLGAFEAGAALGLVAMGVSHELALAFAVLYRVVQWIPVMLAGAFVWGWRVLARGAASPAASAHGEGPKPSEWDPRVPASVEPSGALTAAPTVRTPGRAATGDPPPSLRR